MNGTTIIRRARSVSAGIIEPCEDEVVKQLHDLRAGAALYASRDGRIAHEDFFFAEQNARLAKSAEEYDRSMFRGRHSSWNVRDTHMADTFVALADYLGRQNGMKPKIAVYMHDQRLGGCACHGAVRHPGPHRSIDGFGAARTVPTLVS